MSRILQKTSHWLKKAGRGFTNLYQGPWYKKTVVWIITCVLSVILLLIAVDLNFLYLFGKSPGFKDIEHPVTSEASEIYSADSVLIGRFFSENRTPVEYEDISPIIIQTLIDTEDERFYRHHGIDFQGLFAAVKRHRKRTCPWCSTTPNNWPKTCSECVHNTLPPARQNSWGENPGHESQRMDCSR